MSDLILEIVFLEHFSDSVITQIRKLWFIQSLSHMHKEVDSKILQFSTPSHVQLFAIPCSAACQASLSTTNSWSLLKLKSIESVILMYYNCGITLDCLSLDIRTYIFS